MATRRPENEQGTDGVSSIQCISRNGREALERVLQSAGQLLLICAPFIKSAEMARLIHTLQTKADFNRLSIHLITDLRPESILGGSLDIQAITDLFDSGCQVSVTALSRVHAKVYLADSRIVWVTSANLTTGALDHNFEYGVLIEHPAMVANVRDDLAAYARLGSPATRLQIQSYATTVEALRAEYGRYRQIAEARIRRRFQQQLESATIESLRLQIGTRSAHAVFADAITYLLRSGPMTTKEMHPQIQALLPELCDDHNDRVIDGRHFGKLWKHHVRTAQQHLKRGGVVELDNGSWRLLVRPNR